MQVYNLVINNSWDKGCIIVSFLDLIYIKGQSYDWNRKTIFYKQE